MKSAASHSTFWFCQILRRKPAAWFPASLPACSTAHLADSHRVRTQEAQATVFRTSLCSWRHWDSGDLQPNLEFAQQKASRWLGLGLRILVLTGGQASILFWKHILKVCSNTELFLSLVGFWVFLEFPTEQTLWMPFDTALQQLTTRYSHHLFWVGGDTCIRFIRAKWHHIYHRLQLSCKPQKRARGKYTRTCKVKV